MPFPDAGALSSKLVKDVQLNIYPGFPHGMPIIHADKLNRTCLPSYNRSPLPEASSSVKFFPAPKWRLPFGY